MVMQVNQALCSGCGVCVEACSNSAIQLAGRWVEINQALCTQCQDCVEACPNGAITAVSEPVQQMLSSAALPAVETEIIPAPKQTALPELAGAALTFLGREVAPRLVEVLATALERRLTTPATSATTSLSAPPKSSAKTSRGIRKQARYRGGRSFNGNHKERR